jgi:hypothetical protein
MVQKWFQTHLVLGLSQQLLLADVVEPEQLSDADEDSSLEGTHGVGDLVESGLVDELEEGRVRLLRQHAAVDLVGVDEAAAHLPRVQPVVLGHAHQTVQALGRHREANQANTEIRQFLLLAKWICIVLFVVWTM